MIVEKRYPFVHEMVVFALNSATAEQKLRDIGARVLPYGGRVDITEATGAYRSSDPNNPGMHYETAFIMQRVQYNRWAADLVEESGQESVLVIERAYGTDKTATASTYGYLQFASGRTQELGRLVRGTSDDYLYDPKWEDINCTYVDGHCFSFESCFV